MIWIVSILIGLLLFRQLIPTLEDIVWCKFANKVMLDESILPVTPLVRLKQLNHWPSDKVSEITGYKVRPDFYSYVSLENYWYYLKLWDHTNGQVTWLGRPLPSTLIWLHLFAGLLGVRMSYPQ